MKTQHRSTASLPSCESFQLLRQALQRVLGPHIAAKIWKKPDKIEDKQRSKLPCSHALPKENKGKSKPPKKLSVIMQ
jgi:hypothetical protein